jgi:aspartyl-tRNA(Asn)/glutamyl-tRNA(Gln) amidotransferase subunit A
VTHGSKSAEVPPDPLAQGIEDFQRRFRRGEITAEEAVGRYIDRIAVLDPILGAYEFVAREEALSVAHAMDALLRSGTDLGPLMGVPVALKDIIAVERMPTTCGSNLDVNDLVGPEGALVKLLRRAGCIILGKLKTVEFAIGSSGVNYNRGTPRNPWDAKIFRLSSGSSSGSGVAMAAGLCGFAIGSDTGGSIRGPSAFCGVFGLKTTSGTWPLDGVFPMSRTFDTLGPMTRSAADAAIVWSVLSGQPLAKPAPMNSIRLGRPKQFFFDGLDENVSICIERAFTDFARAGAYITEVDFPEVLEHADLFQKISRTELFATFGRERFLASREKMNPDTADRVGSGMDTAVDDYIRAVWRHRELCALAPDRMNGLDGWVGPSKQSVAQPFPGSHISIEDDRKLIQRCSGPTRPASVFGLCASSQPIQRYGSALPVGLQVVCRAGQEMRLLEISLAIEQIIGMPPVPDLNAFLTN